MESQSLIRDFVIEYFKESLFSYKKNLNEIILKYTKELCNEIISFQMEFNQQNDNLLKSPWTSFELEKLIKKFLLDNLEEEAKLANLKNSFTYISSPLIQNFGEYFIVSYNKGMTRPEFIEKAKEIIKIPFNNIEKKIKDYNELMNKKKQEDNVQDKAPTPLEDKTNIKKPTTMTPENEIDKMSWD